MEEKELISEYQKHIQKYSYLLKELMKEKDAMLDLEKQMPIQLRNSLKGGYSATLPNFECPKD